MKPFRTLIAPVVIAAMAVTGFSAAQARADAEDVAKVLAGVAAVAIIAKALDKKNNDSVTVSSSQQGGWYSGPGNTVGRVVPNQNSRHWKERARFALSATCLRSYDFGRRERELYNGQCLKRANPYLANLPSNCAYRVVERRGGRTTAYGPRCLAQAGFYRVADSRIQPGRGWDQRPDWYGRDDWNGRGDWDGRRESSHIEWGN